MRTTIYVDGFNFYYGCLKHTDYKWLNLQALFSNLLQSHHKIDKIHYFTAKVIPNSHDPNVHLRQIAYLEALRTLPNLNIHYGNFWRHNARMANASPPPDTVDVIRTEEKGSDVNFSVCLVNDAWMNNYDCAVLVTNDSDMSGAMRLVKKHHSNKRLGLFTPSSSPAAGLKCFADFNKIISDTDLAAAQFSNPIINKKNGTNILKPTSW